MKEQIPIPPRCIDKLNQLIRICHRFPTVQGLRERFGSEEHSLIWKMDGETQQQVLYYPGLPYAMMRAKVAIIHDLEAEGLKSIALKTVQKASQTAPTIEVVDPRGGDRYEE